MLGGVYRCWCYMRPGKKEDAPPEDLDAWDIQEVPLLNSWGGKSIKDFRFTYHMWGWPLSVGRE